MIPDRHMIKIDESQLRKCTIAGHDALGLAVVNQEQTPVGGEEAIPGPKSAEGCLKLDAPPESMPTGKCLYYGPLLENGEIRHVEMCVWVRRDVQMLESVSREDGWRRCVPTKAELTFESMSAPTDSEQAADTP